MKPKKEHLGTVIKALVYIEKHLEEHLSVDKVAKHCFMSSYHFHRVFKQHTGENIGEYIQRLRLEKAQGKLCYTKDKIINIGFDAGYEMPSSFSKVFLKQLGVSPRKYRKSFQPLKKINSDKNDASGDLMEKPKIINREDESVLFVRRVGDYNHSPEEAFEVLLNFLVEKKALEKVQSFYGIPLDDPSITQEGKLRFDACVKVQDITETGEVGQKILQGGKYAVFHHVGKYENLTKTFEMIFSLWYPESNETIDQDRQIFCEYLDIIGHLAEDKKRTVIYLPLL